MTTSIHRWSTDATPPRQRLNYWNGVLCETLFGFTIECSQPNQFDGQLASVELEGLTVSDSSGSGRIAVRNRQWIARAPEHMYSMMVDFARPWMFVFRGQHIQMDPGDVVVSDTRFEQEAHNPDGCKMRNIMLPVVWFESWVAEPELFVGRKISSLRGWGAVLSRCLAQLSPTAAAHLHVPGQLLTDQVGSLLLLVSMQFSTQPRPLRPFEHTLALRILDRMRERCADPGLSAAQIARDFHVDEHTVHALLIRLGTTFIIQLERMRKLSTSMGR